MKSIVNYIFFILLSPHCYGQSLDTLSLFSDIEVVTDPILKESLAHCMKTDTGVVLHACHDFHGEELVIHYQTIKPELCDSIKSLSSKHAQNRALSKVPYDQTNRMVRLIPDAFLTHNGIYYSAEVLFQIQIHNEDYFFTSQETTYVISKDALERGLFVKERIPNAWIHFGKEEVKVEVLVNGLFEKAEEQKERIYYPIFKYRNQDRKIDEIRISISNECGDLLKMIFLLKD